MRDVNAFRTDGRLVVYWNNIPAPYMVDRFNALAQHCPFDFEVWFNDRTHSDRSWIVDESAWRFSYRYVPRLELGPLRFRLPGLLMRQKKPDLVVMLYAEPVFVLGWLLAKLRRVKVGFRVLKTFDAWVPRSKAKNLLKRLMFRSADVIETPGADGHEFAVRNGARADRVLKLTHTVNLEELGKHASLNRSRRTVLRERDGLRGTTFLYVGRLWHGKGIESLVEAFGIFQATSSEEATLYIVGDGQAEQSLKSFVQTNRISNVVFGGFKQKPELFECYVAADVFVFPTLGDPYGIVVDEAMACGLPVLSSTAAGEIRSRVIEGVTGYLFEPGDTRQLADSMSKLVADPDRLQRMGEASRARVQDATPTKWASQFMDLVDRVVPCPTLE